jgi:hypothetical protein
VNAVSRTDTQLIQDIKHLFEVEQFDSDAIRKVRQLLAPTAPREDGLHPDYDFGTASEGERWHYDMGYETGWQNRLVAAEMNVSDIREVMEILLVALTRLANEQADRAAKQKATRGTIEFEGGAVIELPDEPDESR